MSKFEIHLKHFKKIKSDKATTTLKHKKHGHEIKLAHSALSPDMKSQLSALPMDGQTAQPMQPEQPQAAFAKGGNVQRYATAGTVEPDSDDLSDIQSNQPIPDNSAVPTPDNGPAPQLVKKAAPSTDSDPVYDYQPGKNPIPLNDSAVKRDQNLSSESNGFQGPVDSGSPASQASPDYFAQMQKGLADTFEGQKMNAQIMGNLGANNALAEKNDSDARDLDQYYAQQKEDQLLHKRAELNQWLESNPVNAQNYIGKMTTGGKIGNAIGLVLGGLGSGLTHGPNMALDYLNKQIDRDIDSQKQNIGLHQNLLSHNIQELGDARQGELLTRQQHNDAVASMLRQNAGNAQNAQTAAVLKSLSGQYENQSAVIGQQMSQNRALSGAAQNGPGSGMMLESLPAEKRDRVVNMPDGSLRLALTKDGAKGLNDQVASTRPIFDSLDQLSQLGPMALVPGSPESQKAEAIRAQMIPLVNENAGLKRLSGEDIQNINKMFADPSKFSQIIGGGAKTQAFKSFLQDKLGSNFSSQLEGGYRPKSAPQQANRKFNFQLGAKSNG